MGWDGTGSLLLEYIHPKRRVEGIAIGSNFFAIYIFALLSMVYLLGRMVAV